MARLILEGAVKRFGETAAVDRVDLEVADGEFVALLGPSGCGKTTILRLIAGFEQLDEGRIIVGETTMSGPGLHVPAEKRRVGIVFQSYALWPHMPVRRNVGYPLEVAGVARDEMKRRIDAALETVGLATFGARRPADLSGGQRQRVALARCLVMEPSLVVLDEPLANLDVHLRASMEEEFARFHRETGATMVYITHDQAEAMALADRVAVMDNGRLVQVAAPRSLYREPDTRMVAEFIGRGTAMAGTVTGAPDSGRCRAELLGHACTLRCAPDRKEGPADFSLRPEDLQWRAGAGEGIPGAVRRATYIGDSTLVEFAPDAAPDERLLLRIPGQDTPETGDAGRVTVTDGWVIPAPR